MMYYLEVDIDLEEIFLAEVGVNRDKKHHPAFNPLNVSEIVINKILLAEPKEFYGYKAGGVVTTGLRNIYHDEQRLISDIFIFFERS